MPDLTIAQIITYTVCGICSLITIVFFTDMVYNNGDVISKLIKTLKNKS